MELKDRKHRAVQLLTGYLRPGYEASGQTWGRANDLEIEQLVDLLTGDLGGYPGEKLVSDGRAVEGKSKRVRVMVPDEPAGDIEIERGDDQHAACWPRSFALFPGHIEIPYEPLDHRVFHVDPHGRAAV